MMKHRLMNVTLLVISAILLSVVVFANNGEVCDVPSSVQQGQQGSAQYDVFANNPIRVSSLQAGFQNTGCGAATFAAAGTRTEPLDSNGRPVTPTDIINACARAGGLSATTSGTFDQYMAGLVALLNQDNTNCYQITIKRIINFTDRPVLTLPAPQTSILRNVRTLTYRPYNFQVADIVDAMQRVSPIAGGIGMGGVVYNAQNEDTAAHTFQPIAINSVGRVVNNKQEHDFKIYDSYFGRDVDIKIMFDDDRRMYTNIWSANGDDMWFHLEELFFTENLGPCTNMTLNWTWNYTGTVGGGSSSRPVRGPTTPVEPPVISTPITARTVTPITPTSCGLRDMVNQACTITAACPPNQYCSFDRFCTCKSKVCGDRVKDPGEECDDGNTNSNDGCSAACKKEEKCGDVWKLASQIECTPPGSTCFRISHGSLAKGTCSSDCTCEPPAPPLRPIE